jgi:hypothetical protein
VRRLLSTIAAIAAAGIIIPAAAAGPVAKAAVAPPRFGLRLVDVPVSDVHNPRGLRYIIDYLPSGTVIHRRILIQSQEPQTGHFTFYPDAARIRNGTFAGDTGHTRSELTTWITVQHRALTLQPQASVMDMVTIKVPRTATRGEHYGVIWVQQVARARSGHGIAVREVSRVGIRIYLAVGRGGAPPTRFAISSIAGHRSSDGRPLLTAHVRNTGGRAVDLFGTAGLSEGPGGTTAGPFRAQQVLTLAPGQSGTVSFAPGRRLPAGPWLARITLVSGLTKVSASATIDFSGHLPGAAWLSTAAMIGGGGLGIAGITLFTVWARRRRGLQAAGELA